MMPFPLPALCVCPVPFYLPLQGIDLPSFAPNASPCLPEDLRSIIFPLWDKVFFREDVELWAYSLHYHRPDVQIWFDVTDLPMKFYFVEDWFGYGAFRYKAGVWEVYKSFQPNAQVLETFESWRVRYARLHLS